jgi:predicted esterase
MNADIGDGASIPLAAEADAPGGTVAKVEFFDGNTLVGTARHAPFKMVYRPAPPTLNFCITARATDNSGQATTSLPVTCVATRKVQRQYKSYDYEETAEGMLKQVRLTIPDGLSTVRGILVVTNPAGGDTRDWYRRAWYGEFLYLHDFAFLGATGFTSHIESLQVMEKSLHSFAKEANRPELLNAPLATTGFSAGGGFASRQVMDATDRVIGAVLVSGALRVPDNPKPGILATPVCVTSGEREENMAKLMESVLETYRPKDAMFAWMTVQGAAHQMVGQEVLAIPFLDATVRLRYPATADPRKGPVQLKTLDPASGWIADNTTWKHGLTSIAPAGQFKGPVEQSSWLPTEDLAFIYRAYATYDNPLTIISPPASWSQSRVWDPGSNVTIVVGDANFPHWKKMEFYDGGRKLGEITQGPPQFTAHDMVTGLHVFSVIGTDTIGALRSSNPVLVIVRKLLAVGDGQKEAPKPPAGRRVETPAADTQPAVSAQPATSTKPSLQPGRSFTLQFSDLPPTFEELADAKSIKPQMTVFLPKNYAPARRYPLLIFLNGYTGGRGGNPGVARALTEETDFICVNLPLFHKAAPGSPGYDLIIREVDGKYMWPLYKRMLAELDRVVPNIDTANRIIGGFSNGAHATQELIDQSDGEAARMFSAFLLVEGGGNMEQYDLIKGKPFLIVSSNAKSRPRAQQICDAAEAAGAVATLIFKDVGKHDFPVSAYPAVREWLRGPAIGRPSPATSSRPASGPASS